MKILSVFAVFFSSVSSAFPCAQFSGRYLDEENVRLEIRQSSCSHISFTSNGQTTNLPLDGKSRLNESGQNQISWVKAHIDFKKLTLEQLIIDKFDKTKIIYEMILSYCFKDPEILIEDTQLFNSAGKLIDYKTMTLLKIKNPNSNESRIKSQSLK